VIGFKNQKGPLVPKNKRALSEWSPQPINKNYIAVVEICNFEILGKLVLCRFSHGHKAHAGPIFECH
jgi:hypothetical protein